MQGDTHTSHASPPHHLVAVAASLKSSLLPCEMPTEIKIMQVVVTALFDRPVVIGTPDICAQALYVLRYVRLDLAIAKEGEPVAVSVPDVVIFESRILDSFEEMDCLESTVSKQRCESRAASVTYTSRPEVDSVLDLAVLEPTTAFLLEDCRVVELVEVCVDVVQCLLLDVQRPDVLMLDLLHGLHCVLNRRLNGGQQSA